MQNLNPLTIEVTNTTIYTFPPLTITAKPTKKKKKKQPKKKELIFERRMETQVAEEYRILDELRHELKHYLKNA